MSSTGVGKTATQAQMRVKVEWKTAGVKCESKTEKDETKGVCKLEANNTLKRQLKSEMKAEHKLKVGIGAVKAEHSEHIKALVQRGLALRSEATTVKLGKDTRTKNKKIKSEKGKQKRRGAKRRCTARKRNASREVINRTVPLSPQLSKLLGEQSLSRPEAVKRFWAHCREQGMLNPSDRREIIFNAPLTKLFSREKARMTDLMGLLMPHFDYVAQAKNKLEGEVVKAQQKKEACPVKRVVKQVAKSERVAERSCKTEVIKAKSHMQQKQEPSASKIREPEFCSGTVAAASVRRYPTSVCAETEGAAFEISSCSQVPGPRLAEAALHLVPRFIHIRRHSVAVECQLSEAALRADHISIRATACRQRDGRGAEEASIREQSSVVYRETTGGTVAPFVEAVLTDLDPALAYRISIVLVAGACAESTAEIGSSPEVTLPQRESPWKWSKGEALQWCISLHIPELTKKAGEYGFDGATLFALSEEDLRALGLTAPFVVRRFLTGVNELRASGI